jgi:hypothetical protein
MTTIPLLHVEARDSAVACTLARGDYEDRTRDLAAFASGALRSRQPIDGGQRLTFTGGAEVERELRAAVAAEAACCAFLDMTLVRTSEGLVLEVTGPAQARPLIAELFA